MKGERIGSERGIRHFAGEMKFRGRAVGFFPLDRLNGAVGGHGQVYFRDSLPIS